MSMESGFPAPIGQQSHEKTLNKEELTNLLKNNALTLDQQTRNFMKWQKVGEASGFFVPKMSWNENAGVIVFADENGETYATQASDELRSALFASTDYKKDEGIGVPAVNSPDGWQSPKAFEDSWKTKHPESYSS